MSARFTPPYCSALVIAGLLLPTSPIPAQADAPTPRAIVDAVENEFLQVDRMGEPLVYDPLVDEYQTLPEDYVWYDYDPPYNRNDDAEIRREIREELWWSPFVDAERVNVMVDDGLVTLSGTVANALARDAAVENAFEGGAVWVDNRLNID